VGSSVTGQSVQPRQITMEGCLLGPLAGSRRRLIEVMAPGGEARLSVADGEREVWLEVVPLRTPEIGLGEGVQHWQAQLKAAYPYWRTADAYAEPIAGLESRIRLPIFTGGTWMISRYTGSYFKNIPNTGNMPIAFTVVLTARSEVRGPELYHMGARTRIKLMRTMAAGETITVCTQSGKRGVEIRLPDGSQQNGFRYLTLDSDLSMALLPGENLLRLGADTNREGLSARLHAPKGVLSGV
jgi:hypothetical protein